MKYLSYGGAQLFQIVGFMTIVFIPINCALNGGIDEYELDVLGFQNMVSGTSSLIAHLFDAPEGRRIP